MGAQSISIKEDLLALGVQVQEDLAADDSDKTFTVPSGEQWEILSVQAQLISTTTVGDRQMMVEAQGSGSEILFRSMVGAVQAESLTRRYNFGRDAADQSAFVNDELMTPLPRLILGPAMVLRIVDIAAVDAAADDMEVRVLVDRRKV